MNEKSSPGKYWACPVLVSRLGLLVVGRSDVGPKATDDGAVDSAEEGEDELCDDAGEDPEELTTPIGLSAKGTMYWPEGILELGGLGFALEDADELLEVVADKGS
jgi:hypothetical protein